MARPSSPVNAVVGKLFSGVRSPWLLAVLAGLFTIDLLIPDPIPFLDETVLAVLTVLAASWRSSRRDERPPPKDVTPAEGERRRLPDGRSGSLDGDG